MPTQFSEDKTQRKLQLLRRKEEEESVKILAEKYRLPYLDLSVFPVEMDALRLIPEEKARLAELAVFQIAGKKIKIALHNPERPETRGALAELAQSRYEYELFLVSKSSLEDVFAYYKKLPQIRTGRAGTIGVSEEKLESLRKEINNLSQIQKKIEEASAGLRTTEELEIILAGALATDASDIHLEPQTNGVRLRYRLDGVLYDVASVSLKIYNFLLSRIKLVSELKLNIHDKAQDGRFTIKTDAEEIEVRTSTLPGPNGENAVLRVLNPKTIQVPFENLGMQPWVIEIMAGELKKPNGMILTTGPTGSGKTTTLYAFLKKIHSPAIKIITIEDPIEYHLAGVEQTQVDAEKGYDFANGLRSIVRQDPDVILVGEIRDLETAETAMHASLTGHLVFSTLHTNSAAGTVPRLLDLGVKPSIIAPAINVAMAQRLVRKLCDLCKIKEVVSPQLKNKIQRELDSLPSKIKKPDQKNWQVFKAKKGGCRECNQTGYKGRIGVFEIILIDDAVEALILREPSEFEIKKEALRQGQINMNQDGLLKILAGITDFEEVERVVGSS